MSPQGLDNFRKADNRLPGPSGPHGFISDQSEDEAQYILRPDREFLRPWMATPGGSAFVWPGGVEGFQLTSNAQTGIHHYIGQDHTDVQVVYPDELHIVLTGVFYGKTAIPNVHALRSVILQTSTEEGQILALPGISQQLYYVATINHQFNHDIGDSTHNVSYSVEFIKTGAGAALNNPRVTLPQTNPLAKQIPRGKNPRVVTTKSGLSSLRAIASKVYGDYTATSIGRLAQLNQDNFDKAGISQQQRVSGVLPDGLPVFF